MIVRTRSDASSFIPKIREEIHALDSTLPAFEIKTMEQVMGDSTSDRRYQMLLLSIFSGLTLVLAVIGIYG